MVPPHEFFFACVLEGFTQGDHVVDDIFVIGNDACFESFDGEGEYVGDDEGLGCGGVGAAEAEAHYFDGSSAGFDSFFDS